MNPSFELFPVKSDADIQRTAELADEIWHQHFTPIIGSEQVDYMLRNLQSFGPMKEQIEGGYEYFLLRADGQDVGYSAIHAEDGRLFLSKLYLRSSVRGNGYASRVLQYYEDLCRARGLSAIWLTCNRFNANSLGIYDHWGFQKIREEKADIGGGYYMDDYIMEKQVVPNK